jgi:CheY-like chemotaxis protein
MATRNLDAAHALHTALTQIFVDHSGGSADSAMLSRVEQLCDAALLAVDDIDCRVAIRGVRSYASLFFSGYTNAEPGLGPVQGVEVLRLRTLNALSAFRGRLNALAITHGDQPPADAELQQRSPSKPESPALAGDVPPLVPPHRHLRILVVEDNNDAAESLKRLLELCNYEVTVATTGREAMQAARRVRPHIVLCDLGLPDTDGFAVASALRDDPDTGAARLIAVTAYGRDEDRVRSREAGFDRHLVKPVDPLLLLSEIDPSIKAGSSPRPPL